MLQRPQHWAGAWLDSLSGLSGCDPGRGLRVSQKRCAPRVPSLPRFPRPPAAPHRSARGQCWPGFAPRNFGSRLGSETFPCTRSLWNPESWVPHGELGFQPATQDVATLENLGTHGTDPRRERDLDAETGQHRSTQHMCAHVYTHTQNIRCIDPTHREDALGKETAHGEAHIHIYQRPHTQRRAHTPPGDPTRRKSTTDTQYHSNRDPTHTENRTTDIHHRCKQGTQHTANTIHTPHTDPIHGEAYHIATPHRWRHPTDTHGHGKVTCNTSYTWRSRYKGIPTHTTYPTHMHSSERHTTHIESTLTHMTIHMAHRHHTHPHGEDRHASTRDTTC